MRVIIIILYGGISTGGLIGICLLAFLLMHIAYYVGHIIFAGLLALPTVPLLQFGIWAVQKLGLKTFTWEKSAAENGCLSTLLVFFLALITLLVLVPVPANMAQTRHHTVFLIQDIPIIKRIQEGK